MTTPNKPLTVEQLYVELESIFNDIPGARFSERVELRKEARLLIDSVYDRADAAEKRADRLAEAVANALAIPERKASGMRVASVIHTARKDAEIAGYNAALTDLREALAQESAGARECRTCLGDGLWNPTDSPRTVTCPDCNGTGKAPEGEQR